MTEANNVSMFCISLTLSTFYTLLSFYQGVIIRQISLRIVAIARSTSSYYTDPALSHKFQQTRTFRAFSLSIVTYNIVEDLTVVLFMCKLLEMQGLQEDSTITTDRYFDRAYQAIQLFAVGLPRWADINRRNLAQRKAA
jgi:hypothetical protein